MGFTRVYLLFLLKKKYQLESFYLEFHRFCAHKGLLTIHKTSEKLTKIISSIFLYQTNFGYHNLPKCMDQKSISSFPLIIWSKNAFLERADQFKKTHSFGRSISEKHFGISFVSKKTLFFWRVVKR